MTLTICNTCKKLNTTKTAQFIKRCDGLGVDLLFFNCVDCRSTFVIRGKKNAKKAA